MSSFYIFKRRFQIVLLLGLSMVSVATQAAQLGSRVSCDLEVIKDTPVGQSIKYLLDPSTHAGSSTFSFVIAQTSENYVGAKGSVFDSAGNEWILQLMVDKSSVLNGITLIARQPVGQNPLGHQQVNYEPGTKVPSFWMGEMGKLAFRLWCYEE